MHPNWLRTALAGSLVHLSQTNTWTLLGPVCCAFTGAGRRATRLPRSAACAENGVVCMCSQKPRIVSRGVQLGESRNRSRSRS